MKMISTSLFRFTIQGAPLDLIPPALVGGGLAGAFRLFLRVLDVKWGWMLRRLILRLDEGG
ncbi:MAG: hypothetical protein P1P72_05445 [ANME-2 cluster archaeon]|nr:hypothetical protein [ANME-2 cluster archaeon]